MNGEFHGLLIGIDDYPTAPLNGSVNDIQAIEALLLDRVGVEPRRIARLAAPRRGRVPTRLSSAIPTLDNLRAAIGRIVEEAKPEDRVFIYYSGHGVQRSIIERRRLISREALVPVDVLAEPGRERYLFDFELNALLDRVRTDDVTVILDCCHAAGIRRGESEASGGESRARLWPARAEPTALPALAPRPAMRGLSAGIGGGERHLVLSACAASELAQELEQNRYARCHGALTLGLLEVLESIDDAHLRELRWGSLWSSLVDRVAGWSRSQHPRLQGSGERRLFGGAWQLRDGGLPLASRDSYVEIGAGTLTGVTAGAKVAVYGQEPDFFDDLGSEADLDARVGLLRVESAERSRAVAVPTGAPFELPQGARGRLVEAGPAEQLLVELEPFDALLAEQLESESLVRVVAPGTAGVEARVHHAGGRLLLGDNLYPTQPGVALVDVGERETRELRRALRHYRRYNLPLRLARRCHELANALTVALLDCSDADRLSRCDPQNPDLPEIARADSIYALRAGQPTSLLIGNRTQSSLYVTILNCTIDGRVELLGEDEIPAGATLAQWKQGAQRVPFVAELPPDRDSAVERLIVVGTTRADVSLRYLELSKSFAECAHQETRGRALGGQPSQPAAERWTAVIVPWQVTNPNR
ncbi:MAG TPA: caspase family protein [Polyangia bacterium]|nr:caspase family protein [Polyangia bacterium]